MDIARGVCGHSPRIMLVFGAGGLLFVISNMASSYINAVCKMNSG